MNENLYTCNEGLRLITQFEGAPRLKARLCEGGAWELSYGVTFDLDGSPFQEGDTCTEDRAMTLFRNALERFEVAVRDMVTVPLTQYQFSSLVAFCYNVGEVNAATSTVIRETNLRRFEDAAAAFGMWIFATKNGHKQALRGLLRRRYAEACLYMGYDWTTATEDDAIALQRIIPEGSPPKGKDRVTYKTPFLEVLRVAQHYPLPESPEPASAIQPLPAPMEPAGAKASPAATPDSAKPTSELVLTKDMQAAREASPVAAGGTSPATQPVSVPSATVSNSASAAESRPAPGSVAPQPSPSGAGASTIPAPKPPLPTIPGPMPPMPPAGTKPISPNTKMPEHVPYRIDPTAGLKPMEETERFVGAALMLFGTFARVILAQGTAVTGIGGIFIVAVLDMMKSPTNLAILVTVITMGITAVLWVIAFIVDKLGLRIKKRGERTSTQAMY